MNGRRRWLSAALTLTLGLLPLSSCRSNGEPAPPRDRLSGVWLNNHYALILAQPGDHLVGVRLDYEGTRDSIQGRVADYGGVFTLRKKGRELWGWMELGPGGHQARLDLPAETDASEGHWPLRKIGPATREGVPALIRVTEEGQWGTARSAAHVLRELGAAATEAVPCLVRMLDHGVPSVHDAARDALIAIGKAAPDIVPDMMKRLDAVAGSESAKSALRDAIASPPGGPAAPKVDSLRPLASLLEATEDAEFYKRLQAVEDLAKLGPQAGGAIPRLVRLFQMDYPAIRSSSANALAAIGATGTDVVTLLAQSLGDEDSTVRLGCARALGQMGPAAVPTLMSLVEDERCGPNVRGLAIHVLGKIGPAAHEAIPLLLRAGREPLLGLEAEKAVRRIQPGRLPERETIREAWPQWRGPGRDNVSRETRLLRDWPEGGPPAAWETCGIGGGISPVVVSDGRVFTVGEIKGSEFVMALDERTGRRLWTARLGPSAGIRHRMMRWLAQRAPTVDGHRIYVFRPAGELVCLRTGDGRELWRKNYLKEFGAKPHMYGLCDYPLVDRDRLICVAGDPSPALIALDKETGRLIWRSVTPEGPSGGNAGDFGATVVLEAAGSRQVVAFLRNGLHGFDSSDGTILWTTPVRSTGFLHPCTPIALGESILVPGRSGSPLVLLGLRRADGRIQVEERYRKRANLATFQDSSLVVDSYLYALMNSGGMFCFDAQSGDVLWGPQRTHSGSASLTYADGHLYLHASDGTVTLIEATNLGAFTVSSFKIPGFDRSSGATNPVVSGGHLFIRDEDRLFCYDVRDDAPQEQRPAGSRVWLDPPPTALSVPGEHESAQAIFVPTPHDVVDRMLEIAGVAKTDVVYDLGSGDGRIVLSAALKHGARSVGYEIDADLAKHSILKVEEARVQDRVVIEEKDLFLADLAPASVVALYLPESLLQRLRPQLDTLRPGARIVSHQFRIPGVKPDKELRMESSEDGDFHTIYLWTAPLADREEGK